VLLPDVSRYGYRVAGYAEQFLTWAAEHFDARWLSSRCQGGNIEELQRAFRLAGSPSRGRVLINEAGLL
jgi:hypothetical protein